MRNPMHAKKLAVLVLFAGAPAAAQCQLTTSFAGFKDTPDGGTAMFDLTVKSWALQIDQLELNNSADAGTPIHIDVYTTPDTFKGKELDPSQWTLRASGEGQAAGKGLPSSVPLVGEIALEAMSSQGIAVVMTGGGHVYENGNGTNEFYENAYLSVQMGAVTFEAFGPAAFLPRVWNGTIYPLGAPCLCPHACDFNRIYGCFCDIFDFLDFQNGFVNSDPCACNMDISTGPDVCDIFDFLAFQNEFINGC